MDYVQRELDGDAQRREEVDLRQRGRGGALARGRGGPGVLACSSHGLSTL